MVNYVLKDCLARLPSFLIKSNMKLIFNKFGINLIKVAEQAY